MNYKVFVLSVVLYLRGLDAAVVKPTLVLVKDPTSVGFTLTVTRRGAVITRCFHQPA